MSTGMKVLNVFGVIFAWLLSIVLVLTLFVAPVTLSALSTIKPEKIVDTMGEMDVSDFADSFLEIDTEDEQLKEFLSTDTVQELYETYVSGLTGIFEEEPVQNMLTEEKINEIIHNNIDELYQIYIEMEPEMGTIPVEEAKQKAEEVFSEGVSELVTKLPSTEELRQNIMTENPEMKMIKDLLAGADTIKLSYIAGIVVLSALIFVCRLHGFRGFRWLAVDLFVATGFAALTCMSLSLIPGVLGTLIEGQLAVLALALEFFDAFAMGVYIRTGIMLISGVVMLVVYLLIKKAIAKKKNAAAPAVISAQPEQTI